MVWLDDIAACANELLSAEPLSVEDCLSKKGYREC